MNPSRVLTAAAASAAILVATAQAAPTSVPAWFVPQALCVHSGWHWSSTRPSRTARPEYRLAGRWWYRTTDVPDSIMGGSGEGGWAEMDGYYGGGLQFMLGTWIRAGGYARSTGDIARASPAEQILRAYVIVHDQDHGSWREWPNTGRACGLPTF